jgi:SAM-dependent methyltransferase
MGWLQPVGDEIIRSLRPGGSDVVLDIAAGTGEPGLTIATMLTDGHVVITDLSPDMIAIARENAVRRGIANVKTQTCDVSELPFDDHTFDAISCRFGFMFFPDMELAAKEMARVLKPGGRIATSVWNVPDKNHWVTAIMGSIRRNVALPPPPPDAPGIFRCAADGMIVDLLRNAGLRDVTQTEVPGSMNSGTVDIYWEMMTEMAAPIASALSNADEETQAKIKREVFDALQAMFPSGNVAMASSALVISGAK